MATEAEKKEGRQFLEGILPKITAGTYDLGVAIKYLKRLGREGWLGDDQEGPKWHKHYMNEFFLRSTVKAIRQVAEKGIITKGLAAYWVTKKAKAAPPAKPTQFIGARQEYKGEEKKIATGNEQVRVGEKSYAMQMDDIHSSDLPLALKKAWYENAREASGALPVMKRLSAGIRSGGGGDFIYHTGDITAMEEATGGKASGGMAGLIFGTPQWLIEHLWIPTYHRMRPGLYPQEEWAEYPNAENLIEMYDKLKSGEFPVETITYPWDNLPEDATTGQKIGAISAVIGLNVARDPWLLWSFAGGFRAATSKTARLFAKGRGQIALQRWMNKAGYEKGKAIADALVNATDDLLADPTFDRIAFTKGEGVSYPRKLFSEVAKREGLSGSAGKEAVKQWLQILQDGWGTRFRVIGREVGPVGRKEVIDAGKLIEAKRLDLIDRITAEAAKQIPTEATNAKWAKIVRLSPRSAGEAELTRRVGAMVAEMARASNEGLAGVTKTIKNFTAKTGNAPTAFIAPLAETMGRYHTAVARKTNDLTRPFRGFNSADRDMLGKLLFLHPQEVRSEQFAKHFGIPVGDVWEPPADQVLDMLLEYTGERTPGALSKALSVPEPGKLPQIIPENLPRKAKRLYTARNETAQAYIDARLEFIDKTGMDLGDKGIGYLTTRASKPEHNRLVRRAMPEAEEWFMKHAEYEHPVAIEILKAEGYKGLPSVITDPLPLGILYARGLARAGMHREIADFFKRYGTLDLDNPPGMAEALGWSQPMRTVESQYLESIGKASPLSDIKEFLPEGVTNYLVDQMKPRHEIQKLTAKVFAPARMARLNTLRFIMINTPEQPFNVAMTGAPSPIDPRNWGAWRAGFRIAIEAMANDIIHVYRTSTPRTWTEKIQLRGARGHLGLSDMINDRVVAPLQDNIIMDNVRKFLKTQKIPEEQIAETLKWLESTDTLHGGHVATLAREGKFNRIFDVVWRNTMGLGVKMGGAIEDFARCATAATMHVSGMGDAETTRRLAAGFVPYNRAWQARYQEWLRVPWFYSTYFTTRPGQIANAVVERPWLAYLPWKIAKDVQDTVFNEETQITLRGRSKYLRMNPKYQSVTWDFWPFSMYKDSFSEEFRNEHMPEIAIPYPALDIIGDIATRTGIAAEGDSSLTRAFLKSFHPYLKGTAQLWHGKFDRAYETVFPTLSRITTALTLKKPPSEKEELELWDKYGHSLAGILPDPEITKELRRADQMQNTIRETTGFITQLSSGEAMLKNLELRDIEELNEVLSRKGKPLALYSNKNQREVAKRAIALGQEPPTLGELNDRLSRGITASQYLTDEKVRQDEIFQGQMGFKEWRAENDRLRKIGGEYVDIPPKAIKELNERRMEASPTKFPAYTPEAVREAEHTLIPDSADAIERFPLDSVPCEPGMCQESWWYALYGKGGFGDANDAADFFVKKGWVELKGSNDEEVSVSEAEWGDFIWQPGSTEYGHGSMVAPNPKTKELAGMSNYEGVKQFRPLVDIPGQRIVRPPRITAFEAELNKLRSYQE